MFTFRINASFTQNQAIEGTFCLWTIRKCMHLMIYKSFIHLNAMELTSQCDVTAPQGTVVYLKMKGAQLSGKEK